MSASGNPQTFGFLVTAGNMAVGGGRSSVNDANIRDSRITRR